jgi:hypothetical protein
MRESFQLIFVACCSYGGGSSQPDTPRPPRRAWIHWALWWPCRETGGSTGCERSACPRWPSLRPPCLRPDTAPTSSPRTRLSTARSCCHHAAIEIRKAGRLLAIRPLTRNYLATRIHQDRHSTLLADQATAACQRHGPSLRQSRPKLPEAAGAKKWIGAGATRFTEAAAVDHFARRAVHELGQQGAR